MKKFTLFSAIFLALSGIKCGDCSTNIIPQNNIFTFEYSPYEYCQSSQTAFYKKEIYIENTEIPSYGNPISNPYTKTVEVNTINSCIDFIEQNVSSGTLVVFDMDEVLGTTGNGENYTHDNFQLSTDLLNAKKSWNEVIKTIHEKEGKAIVLTASGGLDLTVPLAKHAILKYFGLSFTNLVPWDNPISIPMSSEPTFDSTSYYYYKGILCSGLNPKGMVLNHFLDTYARGLFEKVIFVDNSSTNITSMYYSLSEKINSLLIHFTAVDNLLYNRTLQYINENLFSKEGNPLEQNSSPEATEFYALSTTPEFDNSQETTECDDSSASKEEDLMSIRLSKLLLPKVIDDNTWSAIQEDTGLLTIPGYEDFLARINAL